MIVPATHPSNPRPLRFFRTVRAFTLIELLVSILIVAIMMLGINAVFKMSAATVGGGMSVLSGMRDHRAAATTFAADFRGMVNADEMPCFVIYSQTTPGFRDASDEKSDTSFNTNSPSQTAVFTDPVTGYTTPVYYFNNRNHRTDIIQFFTHGDGIYRRQTGGSTGTLQSAYTADSAWVWMGHLMLPDNSGGNFKLPGVMPDPASGAIQSAASNPNNYYANQWALGRVAILLGSPDGNGKIFDANNVSQDYLQVSNSPLSPLAYNSIGNGSPIQNMQCDLAGRAIGAFRSDVQNQANYYSAFNAKWYLPLLSSGGAAIQNVYRFHAKPWINKGAGNLQSETAQTTPILLQGCSQFMVEYAGDYLTQGTNGGTTKEASDGAVDFNTNNGIRSIRWYGLSRSMDGNPVSTDQFNAAGDVRPLATYLPQTGQAPFEKANGSANGVANYICAWSADELSAPVKSEPGQPAPRWPNGSLPWLIRLTIRIDDPNGRLPDGQTLEYIFRTPGH